MSMRMILATAALTGGFGLALGSASAAPLPGPSSAIAAVTAGETVEKATYYRNRGWRGRSRGPTIYFGFGGPRYGYGYRSHRGYGYRGGYRGYGNRW